MSTAPLPTPAGREAEALDPRSRRVVPFDQLVTFQLTGVPDRRLTEVINVSMEGDFVAVALSYSVQPELPLEFGPDGNGHDGNGADDTGPDGKRPLGSVTIGELGGGLRAALGASSVSITDREAEHRLLRTGFQLNPRLVPLILSQGGLSANLSGLTAGDRRRLFQTKTFQDEEVSFRYAIVDNASGREFQSEPIHNIAGLGIANGQRPFRYLPKPVVFAPRSVIRVEITELSGIGTLYFVLQGYKVLGQSRARP
jgi:hypothetical protein